jgi:hypothetical protein
MSIVEKIKKELLSMLDEEISYTKCLWVGVTQMKNDFSKDELVDIANIYIKLLNDKIQKLEEQQENK